MKGIVFTPLTISIKVTPWLKKTLALVNRMSSHGSSVEGDVELESDDELRRLVVEALGESEHKELFSEFVALKHESDTLCELRDMMLGVNVRHSRGSFTVNLDKGKRSGNFWHFTLDNNSAIPIAEFSCMEVSVSGMQLHLGNGWELSRVSSLWNHDRDTWALWFMRFEANINLKFYMVLEFNWDELDDEEIREILQDFTSKMRYALRLNNATTEDMFPPTFKANVVGICWDLPLAKQRLKMSGLWDEE